MTKVICLERDLLLAGGGRGYTRREAGDRSACFYVMSSEKHDDP